MSEPQVGQKVRFRIKGGNGWREGHVSLTWKYEGVIIFDLAEGGSFIPEFGDEWEPVQARATA